MIRSEQDLKKMEPCLVDVGPNGRDCYVVREPDCNENENLEGR